MLPPIRRMLIPRRTILRSGGLLVGGLLVGRTGANAPLVGRVAAEGFTLNGFAVEEPFASYWRQYGGLPQHGLPLSDRRGEPSFVDGRAYAVQYFERAVFELHPELAGTGYEVLLQLLGRVAYQRRYGTDGAPDQTPSTAPERTYFAESGKWVGGRFLRYWQGHGGLRQQGYPLSDEFPETSAVDGVVRTVQYFERAVFEYHPENVAPYDLLLSHLGRAHLARPPVLRIITPADGEAIALPSAVRYAIEDPLGEVPAGAHLHAALADPATEGALELAITDQPGTALLPDDKRLTGRKTLDFFLVHPDHSPYPNPLARTTVRDLIIVGRR